MISLCDSLLGRASSGEEPLHALHRFCVFYLILQTDECLSPGKSVIYWPLILTTSGLSLLSSLFLVALPPIMRVSVPDVLWFYQKQICFSFSLYSLSSFQVEKGKYQIYSATLKCLLFLSVPNNKRLRSSALRPHEVQAVFFFNENPVFSIFLGISEKHLTFHKSILINVCHF